MDYSDFTKRVSSVIERQKQWIQHIFWNEQPLTLNFSFPIGCELKTIKEGFRQQGVMMRSEGHSKRRPKYVYLKCNCDCRKTTSKGEGEGEGEGDKERESEGEGEGDKERESEGEEEEDEGRETTSVRLRKQSCPYFLNLKRVGRNQVWMVTAVFFYLFLSFSPPSFLSLFSFVYSFCLLIFLYL